jgi:pyruvate/2-oxoglutarate dehydrogenase complex dihydrolipoamide acyltransferase (E2) component
MTFEFRLPDIGEGVAEGEIVQWFVKAGDAIREDDPLVSVLTDKANVEIPSPKSGRVLGIHAAVGEKVKVGGLLVTIEIEGSAPSAPASSPAPVPAKPAPSPPTAPAPPPPGVPEKVTPSFVLATPFVRRRAAELGVDLSRVKGTGPGGRITETDLAAAKPGTEAETSSPMWPALSSSEVKAPPASKAVAAPAPAADDIRERIAIRGIRRVIAEHMSESTHRAAHFTYVEEVDMTELVALRDRMAKHVEKQGVRLSYLPFIVKAVVAGLKAHPKLNATMDDAHEELLVRASYHIGIATAAPEGLIVPVVRNADRKSVVALAREIQDLAERGRAGKLTRTELTGSTFTITSLGALGGLLATPILNYPEVAILGVHRIQRRPVYRADGSLGPADLMNLSISLDHRVVDGIEGAQFIATVKAYLEDPHQLFAELA